MYRPSQYDILKQYYYNDGPSSSTLAQRQNTIVPRAMLEPSAYWINLSGTKIYIMLYMKRITNINIAAAVS